MQGITQKLHAYSGVKEHEKEEKYATEYNRYHQHIPEFLQLVHYAKRKCKNHNTSKKISEQDSKVKQIRKWTATPPNPRRHMKAKTKSEDKAWEAKKEQGKYRYNHVDMTNFL